ncbi:MAG TPA: hypothetical protein VK281_14165, partial [Xanthobacteraceae bacterium]|nr:hypothetical protein [Xanthobacteraceae bacterium]
SMFTRVLGSRCVLPLSVSLNLGYRYYAKHLPAKTGPTVYRDPEYMAETAARRRLPVVDPTATTTRTCGTTSAEANFVELGVLEPERG